LFYGLKIFDLGKSQIRCRFPGSGLAVLNSLDYEELGLGFGEKNVVK